MEFCRILAGFLLILNFICSGETGKVCGRAKCNVGETAKFKYAEGTIYRFHHSVNVSLNLGKGSSSSNLFIGSTVSIEFTSPCEARLDISESRIHQHYREKFEAEFPDRAETEFKEKLEKHSVRFAFQDGQIQELCPSRDEAIWALNIKRGILSMLQNTMKRFDVDHKTSELDVNGICETHYRLHEARKTSLIVTKTKNLGGCSNRGKHLSILQSSGYTSPRSHGENNLLDSRTNCEIVIDHHIYERVTCKEVHFFRPLSNGNVAVRTEIQSSLILLEESPKTFEDFEKEENPREMNPTNLLYDHSTESSSVKTVHGELRTSRDLLKKMCILGSSGPLDQTFSEFFTKFIHSSRFLDFPSLSQLLARADGICSGGKKHILDALPFIGSSAAIEVMRDLMIKKIVDRERSDSWMTAIALIPRPDVATVAALLPLVEFEKDNPDTHLTLIYSAVIRAFCQNDASTNKWKRRSGGFFSDDDCLAIEGTGINKFMTRLEDTIEKGCTPRRHEFEDIKKTLEALKAIGNMGLQTDGLLRKLQKCIDDVGGFLPMDIKISAIEAHRRLPSCQNTRESLFLPLYRNITLDAEIRIASYLQVMRCPDYSVIKTIKKALREEPINQVGSFVWSHLTNLLASSSPTRIEIQSLLTDRDLGNKFNSDARKYSRNYETSFFSEEYNVGGTMQVNVIFSSKSYVPRILNMNLTLDLFGESVNAFEGTIRLEGMEYYAEKFFGPDGPLANEKISKYMASLLRSIRSTVESNDLWDGVKRLPNVIDNNFEDPRISLSYKIFGNEIEFKMVRGIDDIAINLAALDPWSKIKRILSGKEIKYEKTAMFLDAKYVVPSTTGLPVKLDVSGSAACNFLLSGLLATDQFAEKNELNLVGNLAPSVSVDITGKMTVDACFKSSAIKLRSNVYSSSAVKLQIDVKGINLIRLDVELPSKQLEVFSMKTDVVFVSGSGAETTEKPAISATQKTSVIANTTCTWSILEKLIGLKLCVDYQFPNVTDIFNTSYFVLNGPTIFRTSVIKADPTAQSYLFEYKWNATQTDSIFRLAFDTPGSKINRESSATVTFDGPNKNVTVLLRSAGNSLVAKGTYKRTDDETMIDVGLDVNGTKHLDGYIGYARKKGTYGYTYTPRVYLGINSERIVELSGTIRDAHKNNVSQCDIDLSFETKKVKSRLLGYIIRRDTSMTGNLKLDYQLRNVTKKETLQIEISLANRSTKSLTHKEANLKLHSSAYPHLNAVINSWYQQAQGHLEIHVEINGKPHLRDDRHKLTAQIVLTYSKAYFQSQEAKMNAIIAINKPAQNLDIKLGIQRFSVGPQSKTYLLIRYAPGKEITLALNFVIPRGSMFVIEGHANMTIPNFDSMIINIRITEKSRKEYDIDFSGSWFSGHNVTIRGTYADRSTIVSVINGSPKIVHHTLKLVLRSPSLGRDVLINSKYYCDHVDTKLDVNVEYLDSDKYALKLGKSIVSLREFVYYGEARYQNYIYGILANVDIQREVRLELHLDRWRDVHLTFTAINEEDNKKFGAEIKWDANRDPALKFLTLFQFERNFQLLEDPISKNITALITISYPGRILTGSCLLALFNRNNYILDSEFIWDPTKMMRLSFKTEFDPDNWKNHLSIDSQILTPFEMWKKTSLNAKYKLDNQRLTANCDAHWQDNEKFQIQLLVSIFEESIGVTEYNANCKLSSTVCSIGSLTANLTHKLTKSEYSANLDNRLLLKYNPNKVVDVRSVWYFEGPRKSGDNISLTGNLRFISPINKYENGDIQCQLRFSPGWKFDGASNVEIDLRRYTGVLRGDLSKIKESMIEFNVTTPIEKYAFVKGRFGLSEINKHAVAEVSTPSGPVGVEAICQLFPTANHDFSVMLKVSSPIEFLQRFLALAKLGKTEADFRITYNNITAGFQAIWHYTNITDFHYSYILFTPIHGLHESGVVAKLIVDDPTIQDFHKFTIDTEFSLRIVETKLGIQAITGPKIVVYPPKIIENPEGVSETDGNDESDEFGWRGDIEVNLAILEPIIGALDFDKEGISYQISGILILPQGKIILDDKFTIEDAFDMKNVLEMKTPFWWAMRIDSDYVFKVDIENSIYFTKTEMNIIQKIDENSTISIETGYTGNYSYSEGEEDDSKTHRLEFSVTTPLSFLRKIDGKGFIEFDENIYKSAIEFHTNESKGDISGSLELDQSFFDGILSFSINSEVITIPKTKLSMKKDFTEVEKRFEAGIEIEETMKVPCKFRATWEIESEDRITLSAGIETWIPSLRGVDVDVIYYNDLSKNESLKINSSMKIYPDDIYMLSGAVRPNKTIDFEIHGPRELSYRFDGKLEPLLRLTGQLTNLKNSEIYLIDGKYNISQLKPGIMFVESATTIIDDKNNVKHDISLNITREKYGLKINLGSSFTNGSLSFNYRNIFNWDTNIGFNFPKLNETSGILGIEKWNMEAFTNVQVNGNTSIYLRTDTPLKEFEKMEMSGNMMLGNDSGDARLKQRINENQKRISLAWKLTYMVDMFVKASGAINSRNVSLHAFLQNPQRAYKNMNAGFDIDVDENRWRTAANASLGYRNNENIDAVFSVKLPPPDNDDHQLLVSYHGENGIQNANYIVGYISHKGKVNYATDGSIKMAEKNMDAHVRFTWGIRPGMGFNNILNATFDQKKIGLKYSLYTPKFIDKETANILLQYDGSPIEHSIIDADLFYPAGNQIGKAHISYQSLVNVNGTLNATTSISRFNYAACNFVVLTTLKKNMRFAQVYWPNDSALINSEYTYNSEKLDSNLEGIVRLEVPLSTRHVAQLNYGYKKRPLVTTGHSELVYNNESILQAQYNSKGESRAGFEKEVIQITLKNSFQPLGIDYVNQFEYSGGNAGTNFPNVESRKIKVYRLDNSSAFSVAGESKIKTTHEGQEIILKAIQSNRTVQLKTDYKILPGEFDHNCWIGLADDAWTSYRINIINKTTEEIGNQFIIVNIAYPRRNFILDGSYMVTNKELSSEGKLSWNKTYTNDEYVSDEKERIIGATLSWKNLTEEISGNHAERQMAQFSLKHPGLAQDATLTGHLVTNDNRTLINATIIANYSESIDKLLTFSAVVKDESLNSNRTKYSYSIRGKHPKTRLDLEMIGSAEKVYLILYKTDHRATYRRSFLPEEAGKLYAYVNIPKNQIEFHKQSNELVKHLDLAYYSQNSERRIAGSAVNTIKSLNATGVFYLNIPEKLSWMMVNFTPDAVQSLRMYGNIPDARNAAFDIWRTYERDLLIPDVAFYLKLNHSRLVTSTLKWRPELKSDILAIIRNTITDAYNEVGNDVDYWKQYVKSEGINAISDIWEDARDDLRVYINDWENLKELDDDLELLKVYLNESYNANDFYIKDLVAVGLYIIDEMALRSHIESLPNIINEIWDIMGESGEAIRKSLLWIIEATRSAYKKFSEIISAVLKGESFAQIASIIEKILEKYDKFIKDLHGSFIKYMENLWKTLSDAVSEQWYKTLRTIEPLFIRVLHYLEAVAWKVSKEVLDFLYDRRNELIKSPYFDRFTNFTQDVDKVYRDFKANDIITNIQKYSGIVISFIKNRYFAMVPFGQELKDVVDEIMSELAELKKLPSVSYALEKVQYICDRAHYFYEYFGVRAKIESAVRVIHSKLMDISQTALQAESKYREAKTKFIFDPNTGIMKLEQKLPMSWHAFNQTPEFQEIPEYRAIIDIKNYFITSNATFWTMYYRYRPYADPYNWLPPFKAQAMIIGPQHFVTFDAQHFDFVGNGTYLLASDFVRDDFALLIIYDNETITDGNSTIIPHKIVVLAGKQTIQVNVFRDSVELGDTGRPLRLPLELENGMGFVYQEESIVTIELKNGQFKLKCNLKYDVCVLELTGWYFGKTAGLLGTMNNERWDDTLKSDGHVTTDIASFTSSWSLTSKDNEKKYENLAQFGNYDAKAFVFCQDLFINKSSEFGDCFAVVESDNYANACENVRTTSDACTLAIGYMQICGFYDTYLRIPDMCTACPMVDGSFVNEGEFRKLEKGKVPSSTDVVFIVEAKSCNYDIKQNRSIDQVVTQLNKELNDKGIKDNRWSLVTFGGNGVYDMPRSLVLNNEIFTNDSSLFPNYFDNIYIGNGNQDVFAAIGFASQLVFRAGVSKTFILMPCSHCDPQNQTLDYSVIHQVLLEHDTTLHILMDGDFNFKKQRLNKIFYGLDASKSYTRKDSKILTGDIDLRRQVKLSKSALGYCTPLSLESNGTIFSGNKLRFDKAPGIKKFASVFAKRVALTAQPSACQNCECTADNDGVTHMECMPCVYPMPAEVEYVSETFNEDDALSILQPLDADYGQMDPEDD